MMYSRIAYDVGMFDQWLAVWERWPSQVLLVYTLCKSCTESALSYADTLQYLTLVHMQNPFSTSLCGHSLRGTMPFFQPEQP